MLKIDNITKSYGQEMVLNNVYLQVASGIKALIGLNGSGKSTLLKIVAGIISPDHGEVWVGDNNLTSSPPELRNIGYVPQHPALFRNLSVEENIRYGMRNGRGSEQGFQELVELLDLQSVLKKKPTELSGGYKSRTSLARALAPQPQTILLDEPLTGMDAALKEKMLPEFAKALKATEVPVLFVTHDATEAEVVADTFAVIIQGQVKSLNSSLEAFELMREAS